MKLFSSVAASIARQSISHGTAFKQSCFNIQLYSRSLVCMSPRQDMMLASLKTESVFAKMVARSFKNVPPKNSRALKTRQAAAKRFIITGKGEFFFVLS